MGASLTGHLHPLLWSNPDRSSSLSTSQLSCWCGHPQEQRVNGPRGALAPRRPSRQLLMVYPPSPGCASPWSAQPALPIPRRSASCAIEETLVVKSELEVELALLPVPADPDVEPSWPSEGTCALQYLAGVGPIPNAHAPYVSWAFIVTQGRGA